jgi:hypothetical protein
MSVDLDRISLRAPRYPDECPFWPCALFVCDDEIVAALYFDDAEDSTGYAVDPDGVVGETPIEGTGHLVGWTLHILADTRPDASDPRVAAPVVDCLGDELAMPDVMHRAYAAVAARATPLGLSYEESRNRLVWTPEAGWPQS